MTGDGWRQTPFLEHVTDACIARASELLPKSGSPSIECHLHERSETSRVPLPPPYSYSYVLSLRSGIRRPFRDGFRLLWIRP